MNDNTHNELHKLEQLESSINHELKKDKYCDEGGKKLVNCVKKLVKRANVLIDQSLDNEDNIVNMKNSISVQFVIALLVVMVGIQLGMSMWLLSFCRGLTNDKIKETINITEKVSKMEVYIEDLEDVVFNEEPTPSERKLQWKQRSVNKNAKKSTP